MAEELEHTEAAEKARKARRTASRRSLQKGGVLYASEARSMAVQRQEDEVARAKAIVERAEKAQTKKERKAFCEEVAAKRKEILQVRAARKKLRKELCREVRMKAKARSKALKAN